MTDRLHFWSTRRGFLSRLGFVGLGSSLSRWQRLFFCGAGAGATAQAMKAATHDPTPIAGAFSFLPLGSIQPRGWLRNQLEIQANGLSGHLDETWADVGPNSAWLGGTGESWERGPYFLDGLIPLAWLLNDGRLKEKAQKFINWTLENQQANGMFGPRTNDDWWPRIVMLKAMTQYQELSEDPRVIPFMEKYFQYQLNELPTRHLRDWGKFRWQDEVLSVLWLYNRTGSAFLIDLAHKLHDQGHDWVAQYADFQFKQRITKEYIQLEEGGGLKDLALSTHGVNNAQAIKTGPVWSLFSSADADRRAVLKMIAELNQYHGLPNGMFSCDEHLAGTDPSQGSELCSVVEYMFSLEQALAITGEASLGDALERLAFNALPGTFTDDMWAHQYNQEPNQVECSLHIKPWTTDGPESNLYGLEPNFGCCTANFHQGWPKFTNSLFLFSNEKGTASPNGLVVAAYAPCEMRIKLRGTPITVVEETEYPFRGTVRFKVKPDVPVDFPLRLRIPGWAAGTTIRVNGEPAPSPKPGTFATVEREWHAGDSIEVLFPMEVRTSRWFRDSVAMERGPLVFSYGIGEDWVKLRDRGMTADWQVFPTTQWNYALDGNLDELEKGITMREIPVQDAVFTTRHAPVTMTVRARKVPEWRADDGAANPLPQSPISTNQADETIILVPYAAAKLRITAFPQCGSGSESKSI